MITWSNAAAARNDEPVTPRLDKLFAAVAAGCTDQALAEVDDPQIRVRMLTSLLRARRGCEMTDAAPAPAPVSAAPLLRRLTPEEWEARYPRSAAP
ncbi:MAG TPA: hypothetical protein VN709_04090 [Terriglobales bacterium]|nr:hypothetical protein [Terriglobales bacterium]